MGSRVRIAINIFVVIAILGYGIYSVVLQSNRQQERTIKQIHATVKDSAEVKFLSAAEIRDIIEDSISVVSKLAEEVSLPDIERLVRANEYVDSAQVYSTVDGVIEVLVTQRRPLFRVISESGYDFYVDSLYTIFRPIDGYPLDVPIITGRVDFEFDRDFYGKLSLKNHPNSIQNIKKLRNFVDALSSDEFLQNLISQVYIKDVKRWGGISAIDLQLFSWQSGAVIEFGGLDNIVDKLHRVKTIFSEAYNYAKLDSAKVIDVRFDGQVVVK